MGVTIVSHMHRCVADNSPTYMHGCVTDNSVAVDVTDFHMGMDMDV